MLHQPLIHTIQVALATCSIAELDELERMIKRARTAKEPGGIHLNTEELALAQTNRIGGVKHLRARTGLGLKEAKELFDLEAPWIESVGNSGQHGNSTAG